MTKWMRGFCVVVASLTLMTDTAFAGGFVLEEHGYYIIDFLVLFGALYFLLRKPARQFLLDRHEAVAKEMEESSAIRAEAETRLEKYQGLLDGLDAESQRLQAEFAADGERERERIMSAGAEQTARLKRDAEQRLRQEQAKLTKALETEVVARAMALAEQQIRTKMDSALQSRLVNSYITELEQLDQFEAAP